jgi:hypothetical protein
MNTNDTNTGNGEGARPSNEFVLIGVYSWLVKQIEAPGHRSRD